jgi:biopolymer transport protein TolR
MKIKRLRNSKKGRIEIIPMIDVMFFLLATFMLASLSMQKINSLPVNLEQGKGEAAQIEKEITITISENGVIFLNKEEIDINSLIAKLQPLISEENDKVVIMADKNSTHGIVSQAMTKASQAGAKHFSIITKN